MVLVDTAGRMQDNAPLMTALAKLIAVNAPDLVLFVGEALVGNEAVDQLVSAESFHEGWMGAEGVRLQVLLEELWTASESQVHFLGVFSFSGQV